MINFNLNISNPWSQRWDILWTKSRVLSMNKAIEFNGYRTNSLFDIEFDFNIRTDHAGARLMLGLFGYEVELHFYDTRHWNNEMESW
jgi:hypothetical protein